MAILSPEEQNGLQPAGGVAFASAPVVASSTSAPGTKAPPKADNATKTLVTGLLDALKRGQDEFLAKGAIEYPDTYNIILDPLLEQARVVPPGSADLKVVPMAANQTARQQLDERTQAVDANSKKFSILAGTSILQFLDQVVRNSTYIYDQQTKYYDPKTKKLIKNGTPANVTGWYRIGMQAAPQGANRYDRKRNDYAYDITYRVELYKINEAASDFFPDAQFRGVHKRYDYWFTGFNTQVLDFQQDFNFLYFQVQNANAPVRTKTANRREVRRYYAQPRAEQSDQMNEGAVSDPSAQLADYLYSPGDTGTVKLKIIGDPAWIEQGEVRGGLPKLSTIYDAFQPDGTICYSGQEALFEILWNKPRDYDLAEGLMDPGTLNFEADRAAGVAGDAVQSQVYKMTKCVSTFSRGQFTQELEGAQIFFDLPQAQKQESERAQRQKDSVSGATATGTRPPGFTFLPEELAAPGSAKGLSQVLDSKRPAPGLPGDSLRTSDYFPESASPAAAPTSGTQVIGTPNESTAETTRLLGTARGPEVGAPSTTLTLRDGQTVLINSIEDIGNYGGAASANERLAAARRLNLAQQAANAPVTNRPPQIIAKER